MFRRTRLGLGLRVDDTTFRAETFTRIIGAVRLETVGPIVADLVEGGLIPVDGETH